MRRTRIFLPTANLCDIVCKSVFNNSATKLHYSVRDEYLRREEVLSVRVMVTLFLTKHGEPSKVRI